MLPGDADSRTGMIAGLTAYGLWGLVPLYFKLIASVPADQILAFRVSWSALVLMALLTAGRLWRPLVRVFHQPSARWLLLGSTVMIAANWYLYIYSVQSKQMVQSSLGYFINPLLNVVLGLVVFGERLRPWQWAAVALAFVGFLFLASDGGVPWLALGVASTFSAYGLLRKQANVHSLVGLSIEALLLLPLAIGWLVWATVEQQGGLVQESTTLHLLLAASGLVTTVPLLCFGVAARKLPFSTLGFLQYISPSVQLFLAAFLFGEPFARKLPGFLWIWLGLALYTADSVRAMRRVAPMPKSESMGPPRPVAAAATPTAEAP